ncbi:MAG: FUSC family protein [Candidatus Binataceae bacterium]
MIASTFDRAGVAAQWLTGWSAWLTALLAEELAPRPRKLRVSLRMAVVATIGAGLMTVAHIDNPLGPYVVWLMLGPVAMMSLWTAAAYLMVEAPVLAASVLLAQVLAETPWLMLPFIGAFTALSTYLIIVRKLGSFGLVMQVVALDSFYGVVFAPGSIGWSAAAVFGGCAIAFGLIALFDTWLWPDPAEAMLLEALAGGIERTRSRFAAITGFYLGEDARRRPPEPSITSDMPVQLTLLNRATTEGMAPYRRAVLLAAISRATRLHIAVNRLTLAAREDLPHDVRAMVRPEIEAVADAIAAALDEIAREVPINIRTGPDERPPPQAAKVPLAMDSLDKRVVALRPAYIDHAGAVELANFAEFTDALHDMTRLIERPLDEPPPDSAAEAATVVAPAPSARLDPALARYCVKVALCTVIGYVIGITSQRPEMSVILTTVIVTALPTYGASLHKMILRLAGTALGGIVAILAIVIVTPNFETLPSYMLTLFIVLFLSAYASLSSGRIAYAGKSIGTTFVLVFAGLSPSRAIYEPLWRTWGILVATIVVTIIFFALWPEYAGDSLLPRLRRVIGDTLALAPSGAAAASESAIHATSREITGVLGEILEVADDARLEGRRSLIDHDAVVQATGTLRRIAHRLGTISLKRITRTLPRLDDATEAAHDAILTAIRIRLEAWLTFFDNGQNLTRRAGLALAAEHSRAEITRPLEDFSARLAAGGFAQINLWTLEQRRQMLAELQSLRRLEVLAFELDNYLARVPGAAPAPAVARALRTFSP